MRCLILHCRTFSYTLDHPTAVAEPISSDETKKFTNCLVVFATCESHDTEETAKTSAIEVARVARSVSADQTVINPFAHLSNDLAKPEHAMRVLHELASKLAERGVETEYSPFGWYKEFCFEVFGHDNSQLFRAF